MAGKKSELDMQAQKILELAASKGLQENFFFTTTFERYATQMAIMKKLKKEIESIDTLVTKEYVKERENLCVNPAISEYNKTATAANGTVKTLINIIGAFAKEANEKKQSKLEQIMFSFGDE